MPFFGTTDYRRAADMAVPSSAPRCTATGAVHPLRDRMDTAIGLYKDRLVKKVLVSGGVGGSGYNEALVMRDMAVKAGVPKEDVVVDPNGVNTEATVRDSIPFFRLRAAPASAGREPVLPPAAYQTGQYQTADLNVFTVPAGTSTPPSGRPCTLVAHEIPALPSGVYYPRHLS